MPVYANTSFLCSYFLPDANSVLALAAVRSLSEPMAFTALHRLELKNAFAPAVFHARITPNQAAAVWQDIASDLAPHRVLRWRLRDKGLEKPRIC